MRFVCLLFLTMSSEVCFSFILVLFVYCVMVVIFTPVLGYGLAGEEFTARF